MRLRRGSSCARTGEGGRDALQCRCYVALATHGFTSTPVRILCCVNRDLYSNYALNLLLPELARAEHVSRVVMSDRVGTSSGPSAIQALRAIEMAIPNEVVFPIAQRFCARDGRLLTFEELSVYCDGVLPISCNLNANDGRELLDSFSPELIITIRYGFIMRSPTIARPSHGVINLHSGILPQYRGILSTLYAITNGEADIGCTLHWIVDAGIDTGPIIAIARRPVESGRSLLWHILSLYPLGVPLIIEAVRRITSGEPLPQHPQAEGTYRSTPGAADVDALAARGMALFDASDLRDIKASYLPGI